MTRPADLPEELRDSPFDVRDAHSRGVGSQRLRRKDLRRPFRGVRAPIDPDEQPAGPPGRGEEPRAAWARAYADSARRAREYAVRMPPDQFFSHLTAAFIHELPLPRRFREYALIDVATTVRTQRRKGISVRGHLVPAGTATVVAGLRIASVVDTWCQLGTILTLDELVIAGDSLVCRQGPQATMRQLLAAVARQGKRPGARRLREALTLVRPRTDSPRETILRLIIVRADLPEPEPNGEILGRFGEFLAWGDLVYRRYKVLVEYDGEDHRLDERQFHRDFDRIDRLIEEGWRVIRFNKSHLGPRSNEIVGRIRRALLERGWSPR